MKKFLVALLCGSSLFALPVGNPWDASLYCEGVFGDDCWFNPTNMCPGTMGDQMSVRVGYYGDYVFDRRLKRNKPFSRSIHKTAIVTNAGLVAVNFYDRFDVFATFGTSSIAVDTSSNVLGVGATSYEVSFDTDTDFSYNVGVRATLWTCRNFEFGGVFQYFNTNPKLNRIVTGAAAAGSFVGHGGSNTNFKYQEWQFALGFAYNVNLAYAHVIPYGAIKWAHGWTSVDDMAIAVNGVTYTFNNWETSQDFGFALGITLVGCEKWTITLEGDFADETALAFNTQFRF